MLKCIAGLNEYITTLPPVIGTRRDFIGNRDAGARGRECFGDVISLRPRDDVRLDPRGFEIVGQRSCPTDRDCSGR